MSTIDRFGWFALDGMIGVAGVVYGLLALSVVLRLARALWQQDTAELPPPAPVASPDTISKQVLAAETLIEVGQSVVTAGELEWLCAHDLDSIAIIERLLMLRKRYLAIPG